MIKCRSCLYQDVECFECSGGEKWESTTEHISNPEGSAKTSSHYQVASKQPIEIMQEVMSPEAFQGFCRGNVIKYTLRLGHKNEPLKEAAKIEQYAKWLRESLEGKQIDPRS